jgi:FKBP-type peptidyl-prolyl cis-trans isomerase 2
MSKVKEGQTVNVHYIGTLDDGTEFDNSRKRGKPLPVQVGSGQLISGFNAAIQEMALGETKEIRLTPQEAYGEINPDAIQVVPQSSFPDGYEFKVGNVVQGQNEVGQQVAATIHSLEENDVKLDFNHPLAGKNLNFKIELLDTE